MSHFAPFGSASDHGGVGGDHSREEVEVGGNGDGSAGKGGGDTVVREKMSMVNGTREGGLVVMKPMCKTMFCTVDCNVYRV